VTPVTEKRKRGRSLGSGSGSNAGTSSSTKHVVSKMKLSKMDLDNTEWELQQNPGRRGSYVKKKKAILSRTDLGLSAKQWQIVRDKTEIFDVSSTADVAVEASRLLDEVENARSSVPTSRVISITE